MAEIFLAQDKRGSICALKRILPHLAHEESFIRMFIDEARIVSHLEHTNIAGVYDQGKHAGYYYIAMEFVQGHSLLAVSDRAKSMKIPLPRGLLSYIVAELLAGLGCAHSARDAKGRHLGIVHRDVTPQNVIVSYDGDVKLIDFGVAKARARLTQTEAGFTKGKLSYMSPEQARGEELDARSDLFSVGIILYEVTTNTRLFNKEGPGGILGAIVNDPVPPPTLKVKNYPKQLEAIVMKGLEKDVHRRWQSAEEMREALLRYARNEQPAPGQQRLKDLDLRPLRRAREPEGDRARQGDTGADAGGGGGPRRAGPRRPRQGQEHRGVGLGLRHQAAGAPRRRRRDPHDAPRLRAAALGDVAAGRGHQRRDADRPDPDPEQPGLHPRAQGPLPGAGGPLSGRAGVRPPALLAAAPRPLDWHRRRLTGAVSDALHLAGHRLRSDRGLDGGHRRERAPHQAVRRPLRRGLRRRAPPDRPPPELRFRRAPTSPSRGLAWDR